MIADCRLPIADKYSPMMSAHLKMRRRRAARFCSLFGVF
jgi:hypothetical protein